MLYDTDFPMGKSFFFFQAPVGGWFDSLVSQCAEMSVTDGIHLHELDIGGLVTAC